MIIDKLREGIAFTNHEQEVARYVLEHIEQIPEMSTNDLAKASFTSKATVVRLCKKIGLSGYQQFKLKLVEEINQKKRMDELLVNEPITDKSTYQDIINALPILYDKAVTNTKLALDQNCMNRIRQVLLRAECIDIYATGISYMLAQAAAFKFATLGMECSVYESINGHYLAARKNRIPKKTIAFVVSFTGANRTVIRMAQYLREATNNYVVGIVGPHNQVIKKWCHEIVEIANRDSLLSLDVITSFSAATYVFDIFFSIMLSNCYEKHAKSSMEMLSYRHILLDKSMD